MNKKKKNKEIKEIGEETGKDKYPGEDEKKKGRKKERHKEKGGNKKRRQERIKLYPYNRRDPTGREILQ
ncbi:hypothetical protein, partial [Pantoea sp. QMID1]|uniref:hypothetical protein n=1 Tax=Pantoea sp. QMID1 TaxID=3016790 RepID=UPI0025546A9E